MTNNRVLSLTVAVAAVALFILPEDSRAQYALQYGAAVAVQDGQAFVGEGRNLLLPGSVFVYDIDSAGRWERVAALTAWEGGEDADGFGRAIAASGTALVVGAPETRQAYVFRRASDGSWERHQVLSADVPGFGQSVAVTGSTVVVGAPGDRGTPGQVRVYVAESGAWRADATLTSPDTTRGASFGATVAAGANLVVVGAPGSNRRAGLAYAFERDGAAWGEAQQLDLPGPSDNDRFGSAVAVAGDEIVIGAPGHDRQTGVVATYARAADAGGWEFVRRYAPSTASGGEMFGSAVAVVGNGVLIGSPGHNERSGAAYLYVASADGATATVASLGPATLQYRSSFGNAVAAHGNLAVVGAVGHDNFEGAAFPFVRSSAGAPFRAGDVMINDSGQFASVTGEMVECTDGTAEGFTCSEVDMVSFLSRSDIGARRGIQVNDVWGWEDPETGREYALVGRTDGTSFIDLSDPYNPIYLGDLPKTPGANQSIWRDIKTYRNHAFIVSDGAGAHHMQVFDLTQLRTVRNAPVTFEPTALYKGIFSSHNIVINEETGFAYAVGSDSGGETCGGALHMIDIRDPVNPRFAGCFADVRTGRGTGATHDAQCVVYRGPDSDYTGREICLSSNGSALSIADVTDKDEPRAISIAEYPNVAYTHQGWLTEDHRYFYLNDEGDEVSNLVEGTRTLILDLADLDDPVIAGEYVADHNSIDHNLYVRGNVMYQTNYSAGLRLLDISDPEKPVEVGHFDTVPYGKNDNSPVLGAWSNYPYFKSGVIVVTSGREGVFFLKKRSVDI